MLSNIMQTTLFSDGYGMVITVQGDGEGCSESAAWCCMVSDDGVGYGDGAGYGMWEGLEMVQDSLVVQGYGMVI